MDRGGASSVFAFGGGPAGTSLGSGSLFRRTGSRRCGNRSMRTFTLARRLRHLRASTAMTAFTLTPSVPSPTEASSRRMPFHRRLRLPRRLVGFDLGNHVRRKENVCRLLLHHLRAYPLSMVGDRAGMRISTDILGRTPLRAGQSVQSSDGSALRLSSRGSRAGLLDDGFDFPCSHILEFLFRRIKTRFNQLGPWRPSIGSWWVRISSPLHACGTWASDIEVPR